ncbi:hypothetical protein LXA43DRAFT_1096539 [Ganoderma leucocontextum]|nr:hypothetical protein LXA43DRAFT_1096539 [Ganoderma leucocontextum]
MRHATMGSDNEFLIGQFPQLQRLQQPASLGAVWPQYPPQGIFNPGIAQIHQHYPAMVPMPPQSLPQSPIPARPVPGEQPPWFQALVAAVSKELKSGEKKAVERDVDKENMASALLSAEDEKALIDGLKKWKEGGMKMQQVFEELSQKNGHPEIVWKTWFIANFERLNSKVILNPNAEHASACSTGSTGSRSQAASRTRSTSSNRPLRSSTLTATNERRHSRDEPQSEREESSDDSDQGSTYRDSDRFGPRDPATKGRKTTPIGRPPRAYKQRTPVTDADLRAIALYMFQKGDRPETRPHPLSYWREFAQRPENRRKRTLDAWHSIPRKPAHAAAIERYVEKHQRAAERARSENKLMASPSGAGIRHAKVAGRSMQDRPSLKRKKASQDMDLDYIIDLTDEKEE